MLKTLAYLSFLLFTAFISILIYLYRNQAIRISSIEEPKEVLTEIIVTGDVMLGRTVMTKSLELDDPTYPMKLVAGELRDVDLVLVNLENQGAIIKYNLDFE